MALIKEQKKRGTKEQRNRGKTAGFLGRVELIFLASKKQKKAMYKRIIVRRSRQAFTDAEHEDMQERLYQKLIVWQQAHALCLEIYSVTKVYPDAERFRLIDQSCRAAASVPTNIAEGNSKSSVKEKKRYVGIAEGSLMNCIIAVF